MKQHIKQIKKNIKDLDKWLLLVVAIMVLYGLFNILTASSRESVVKYNNSLYYYFEQHGFMLIVAFIGSFIIVNIPTKLYRLWGLVGLVIIIGMLTYTSFWGELVRGSRNWMLLFGKQIQPSEFAKPILIVSLAVVFEIFNKRLKSSDNAKRLSVVFGIWAIGIIMAMFIFLQKDFGTMFIIVFIFGIMFLGSNIQLKDKFNSIAIIIVFTIIAFGAFYLKSGYILTSEQIDRLDDYMRPCQNYASGGYQICNGFIALNDGGLYGLGISNSKQKYSYIPDPHTDSVFAIIGEELGVIRSSLIFLGYIFILYRIIKIASQSDTIRGRYICIGVATYLFIHIFVNLGGILAVIPFTGVPLPFFSYGGTFIISLLCSIAMVQRVHIENKNKKIKIR